MRNLEFGTHDQVLQNRQIFDTLRALKRKDADLSFRDHVKSIYTKRQRADISDIIEPAMTISAPFGLGHKPIDPNYWYYATNHGTEIFAEMFSAEIGNHASLETIKEFYPETYKVFREMLGAMR